MRTSVNGSLRKISVCIEQSPRQREQEKRYEREEKISKQLTPAPIASTVGPTIIRIIRTPWHLNLPSNIADPTSPWSHHMSCALQVLQTVFLGFICSWIFSKCTYALPDQFMLCLLR